VAKVVVRIKGGLGNQLFCYAAARRLALVNHAELAIDDVTGFARDRDYGRQYMLDRFAIPARKATRSERLEPLERYRRGLMKWRSRKKPFAQRTYVEQEGLDFDQRLLSLRIKETVFIDGLWQSERYFKDVESTIREDLTIIPPTDTENQRIAAEIRRNRAVALHVRWFDPPGSAAGHNLSEDYYQRAIALVEQKLDSPHFVVFSDDPEAARSRLGVPENRLTLVSHNKGDQQAYADLWLMTQCQHFIIANSTFSWWGAWLGSRKDAIVISPAMKLAGAGITAWNFDGQIPERWLTI
jgi:hypothetical protein